MNNQTFTTIGGVEFTLMCARGARSFQVIKVASQIYDDNGNFKVANMSIEDMDSLMADIESIISRSLVDKNIEDIKIEGEIDMDFSTIVSILNFLAGDTEEDKKK